MVFQRFDLALEGEELLVIDEGCVGGGIGVLGSLGGGGLVVVPVSAVLESVVLFLGVFPGIAVRVDICEEIVLFLEKMRSRGSPRGRELSHVVVIN